MCFSSPSVDTSATTAAAAQQAADAAQQQATIANGQQQITGLFSQYTPAYYQGLAQDYSNYYNPQLQDQYTKAQQQQLFSNANSGNINSSAGAYENAQLEKQEGEEQQQLDSSAQDYSQQAQQQVAGVQSNLTNQLLATSSTAGISPDALNQIHIQNVQSMAPLTNLFTTAGTAAAGASNNGISSGLFGVSPTSSSTGSGGNSLTVVN